jgi:hypothetical protein
MNMKFAESQFAEAIELLQTIDPTKSRKDKRRANRTEIRVSVDIKLNKDVDSPWTTVELRDISARGARIESAIPIEANESFLLRLPLKDKAQGQMPLICRAAHCRPNKQSFTIGAEFIGRQTPDAVQADSEAERGRISRSILG